MTMGIPLGELMVSLGFKDDASSFSEFKEEIQNSTKYDDVLINKTTSFIKKVNTDVLGVISACINSNGLHTYYENTADPDVFYIITKFKWVTGNHEPINVKMAFTGNNFTINGIASRSVGPAIKSFTLESGDEMRFIIKKTPNSSVAFTFNTSRGVPKFGGNIVFPAQKQVDTRRDKYEFQVVQAMTTPRTVKATKLGGGDSELKRWGTTQLDGNATLVIVNNSLKLNVDATVAELVKDNTAFKIKDLITLYTPQPGRVIAGYNIDITPSTILPLSSVQADWVTSVPASNIAFAYSWQGDTGKDDDSIDGCWIVFDLKPITVLLKKQNTDQTAGASH